MEKLDAMHAFTKVVATGSYAEAARQLGLTRSAVSKAVMELEHRLAVRLFDRTTRQVSPTEAGRTFFTRCQAILAEVEEAEDQIAGLGAAPRGVLRVNGPMSFGTAYLAEAVAQFVAPYPELRIELTLNDRRIDPLEEGFDVTVRIGALADSSLIARRIATAALTIVAAPVFLAQHGTPDSVATLGALPWLTYGQAGGPHRVTLGTGAATQTLTVNSVLCANNGEVLREAAAAGLGITVLPRFIAGPWIADGRLTAVLPDAAPPALPIHALYAPNRYLAAKTRLFIDFLADRFAGTDWDAC